MVYSYTHKCSENKGKSFAVVHCVERKHLSVAVNGGALQFLRGEWKVQEKALFWQVHDIWRPWTETLIDERALSRCTHTLSPSFSLHRPVKQRYVVEPLYLLSRTRSLYLSGLSVSNTLSPWQVEACRLIYPVTPSVKNPFKKFMIFPHTLLRGCRPGWFLMCVVL